jgi:hypothetical protein
MENLGMKDVLEYMNIAYTNKQKTEKDITNEIQRSYLVPSLSSYAEKLSQVNIKESNYFNII